MIEVYHGSFMEIRKPDISFSRQTLDFGKGFYVTPLREQAVRWALRWQRRGKKAIVNTYVFDDSSCALAGVRVKDFPEYDSSWLRFIMENRSGQASESYDIMLEFFYRSETYQELRDGIADLHCRSDQYVVDELKLEFSSTAD